MEYQRLPRRCSSHGTLRGSYSHHRKPGHSLSIRRPLHKPLRAVNENSILLPSPGALESMLKTTTETGDIGMWTIKPVIPSSQRKESFSDISRPLLPSRSENQYNRGHMPCHSQTTSEIQSLYTSGSQRSVNSTLPSSSTGDYGHRSFSMTTCGSRYLPRQASNLTLQTQASSLHLQRPRSPFPYPTRLRRPGVRPASPALTETGIVDYSRMVEIDRISSRTEHGSFRSMNPSFQRHHRPLVLRSEANGSTPALRKHRGLVESTSSRSVHPPTMSAASIVSWNARNHDLINNQPDPVASFTSLCQPPVDAEIEPRIENDSHDTEPETIPQYYDYTEQFDQPEESRLPHGEHNRSAEDQSPESLSTTSQDCGVNEIYADQASVFSECLSPDVSQSSQEDRSQDTKHSMADLRADDQSSVIVYDVEQQIAQDRGYSRLQPCSSASVYRVSDIDLLPSQIRRTSIDTFNPQLDIESRPVNLFSYPNYRSVAGPSTKTSPLGRPIHVETRTAPTIHSEQGIIFGDQTPEDSQFPIIDDCEESFISDHIRTASSQRIQMPTAQSISSISLIEAACTPAYHPATNDSQSDDKKTHHISEQQQSNACFDTPTDAHEPCPPLNRVRIPRSMTAPGSFYHEETLRNDMESTTAQRNSQCNPKRNKRREAFVRISDPLPPREAMAETMIVLPSCTMAPLLEPKPISATRQLKVKNSIPHLMKALPPLPRTQGGFFSPSPALSDDGEYGPILKPFNFVSPITQKPFDQHHCLQTRQDSPQATTSKPQPVAPKLRLKMTLAPSRSGSHIQTGSVADDKPVNSTKHFKKLRLGSSRSSRKTNSQEDSTHRYLALPIANEFLNMEHKNGSSLVDQIESGSAALSTIGQTSAIQGREALAKQISVRGSSRTRKWDPSGRDVPLQHRASQRLKTRMSGVLRWLNETKSHSDEFLAPSHESSPEDRKTIGKNMSRVNHIGDRSPKVEVTGVMQTHRSFRKLVRAKLVRFVKGAGGVVRNRTKRRPVNA